MLWLSDHQTGVDYCKTLNICSIKFSQFDGTDILANFNFGVLDISWLLTVKKVLCKFVTFFQNFPLNYPLCHLLESPHGGDSNGMPQYIVSWDGIENISSTHEVLHFI